MSGKYFLQSGLRVLELLVEMDLVSEVLTYRKSKGEEAYAAIINRLDRPVSGLVLHKYNPDKLVRPDMPPVFICETDDDRTTLSENSVGFYMAARKAGVSAELHIFRTGGHGYGCGDDFAQTGEWKVLFTKWIKSIGIIS